MTHLIKGALWPHNALKSLIRPPNALQGPYLDALGTCYCLGDLAKYLEDCIVYRPLSEDDLGQDKITYRNR